MELRFTGVGFNTAHGSSAEKDQRRREHDTSGRSLPEEPASSGAPDESCRNGESGGDDCENEQVIRTRRNVGGSMLEQIMTGMSLRDRSEREQRNKRGEAFQRGP